MKHVKTIALAALIALTTACGYSSKNYATPGAMPAIAQINPTSATAGGTAFTLTVTGSNFAAKAAVNWNGVAQTTGYVSGTQLTVAVPSSMIANPGTVQITVTNPATSVTGMYGSGGTTAQTSNMVPFMIN